MVMEHAANNLFKKYIHSMDPVVCKTTVGCGVSHKQAKHMKYAKYSEL